MNEQEKPESFLIILSKTMIEKVPSYGNKFFYSLGFLSMISFVILIITGCIMAFEGSTWWLTSTLGIYTRSVHMWATQAFVIFMLLHLLIVFLTSGFKKPRQLTWVLGGLMFFFVLLEAEFGYVLRGDFSAQWRSLQGADLYNGSGIGQFINNLNNMQIIGIHAVLIPLIIISLLFFHYLLVKSRGIAAPYIKDVQYTVVKADHTILFIRGGVLAGVILLLAIFFKSPFIAATTIQDVATQDPTLLAKTLISEMDQSSDTAIYLDNIDPYTFNTKQVFIEDPYMQYIKLYNSPNMLSAFDSQDSRVKLLELQEAKDYFATNTDYTSLPYSANPVVPVVTTLVRMAQTGLYEASLRQSLENGSNGTYVTRFLADTGVLQDKATNLYLTTDQYGMVRDESGGTLPPGAWWLTPLGFLDHTLLSTDPNQDRDGAIIIGTFILLLLAFPYIPFFNRLPELFRIDRLIWKEKNAKSS